MSWQQDRSANLDASARKYLCLTYVVQAFGDPGGIETARQSWDYAARNGFAHGDRNLPNVQVPLYWSWFGRLGGVYQDWGHVAIWNPGDGKIYSTRFDGDGHRTFDSIDQLSNFLPGSFLGWSEAVNKTRVAHWNADPAPANNGFNPASGVATVQVAQLNVRSAPSTSSTIVDAYAHGQTVRYDGYVDANGYRWLTYVGGSGNRRYIAEYGGGITYVSGGV